MLELNEVFPENEPKARYKFLSWFNTRQSGNLEIDKMPAYMALAAVITWLDSKGIYIDRDTSHHCFRVWDYRDSEPENEITVEWHPDDTIEENLKLATTLAIKLYCKDGSFYKKIDKPIDNENIDDLPF